MGSSGLDQCFEERLQAALLSCAKPCRALKECIPSSQKLTMHFITVLQYAGFESWIGTIGS